MVVVVLVLDFKITIIMSFVRKTLLFGINYFGQIQDGSRTVVFVTAASTVPVKHYLFNPFF
jgi:hypothetical protein